MIAAVFDCNVLLQAALSRGPASRCLERAGTDFRLWCSEAIIAELTDVLYRPAIRLKFAGLDDTKVEAFLQSLRLVAIVVMGAPKTFPLARDPDDEKYLDIAIAANATYVVSRDHDLLDLMTDNDLNSQLFRAAFPEIEVLTPEPFLARLPLVP